LVFNFFFRLNFNFHLYHPMTVIVEREAKFGDYLLNSQ
jgi:hypothetical protein